ncbi:MAG TPA: 3-hydroxy-5-phosphonooxypentane-2,4-dione thiolase LsrF, partial [Candidatus Bathyarchaeia archaeon]|nr:3-hydroxy-5-phosphonooxypentane-2,4-dione thiolase LsrF [Candidatus Bathyarchaeia archaeon]
KVVKGCPVPLVVAGGPKLETELDAFQLARDAIEEGAVGVDMGRNIWQSEHPVPMIKAIREIIHGGATVREAQEVYNQAKNTKEALIVKTTAAR